MGHYASEMGRDLSDENELLFKKYDALRKKLEGLPAKLFTVGQLGNLGRLLSPKKAILRSSFGFHGDPEFLLTAMIRELEKFIPMPKPKNPSKK